MPSLSSVLALAILAAPASPRTRAIERMNEGVRLAKQQEHAEAERALQEATRIDPRLAHAWLNLGQLQLRTERPQDAAASFRRGLAVAKGAIATELHLQLGLLLQASARGEERPRERRAALRAALEHLQAAAADAPELAFVHVAIGEAYEQLDQPARADAAYRRAIEVDSSFTPAFVALGSLYIDHGFANLGLAILETGVQLNEGDARAFAGLGQGFAKLGRSQAALEAFEIARRLDPRDPMLSFHLGMAHAELGEREPAAARLHEFLERVGPDVAQDAQQVARATLAHLQRAP